MFSAGFSSGAYGGNFSRTIFSGTANFGERCHPAPSTTSKAIAPPLTHLLISIRCLFMASMLTVGNAKAAPTPRAGQTAPKRYAQVKRRSRGARGRLPSLAQMRVSVPCWPTLASSWNQISTGLPAACLPSASLAMVAKFF